MPTPRWNGDEGNMYLRAMASYTDGEDSGKSASMDVTQCG